MLCDQEELVPIVCPDGLTRMFAKGWPSAEASRGFSTDPNIGAKANIEPPLPNQFRQPREHSHYFKDCPFTEIDVYRTLELFGVTDQAIGHAIKKLLVAGGRGAGKDVRKDVKEAADTLIRWQQMRNEDDQVNVRK